MRGPSASGPSNRGKAKTRVSAEPVEAAPPPTKAARGFARPGQIPAGLSLRRERLDRVAHVTDARAELLDLIKNWPSSTAGSPCRRAARPTTTSTCAASPCTTAAAPLIGAVMLELTADWAFDAVGGLTLGADPVATAMLHASDGRLDAFVVRKSEKPHGLQRRIEGPSVAGRRVLAVEDTSTTGGSVLTAVEALRKTAPRWSASR